MLVSTLETLDVIARGASSPALVRRLREIHAALQQQSPGTALKLIDRAWRALPDAPAALAPIYGRLLLLEERDADAALRVLGRVESPDADVAALTVRAYLRLRRCDDARRALEAALRAYALVPQGLLASETAAALRASDLKAVGWIGVGPSLEFIGELAPGHGPDALDIRIGERPIQPFVYPSDRDGRIQFRFFAPDGAPGETLQASSRGIPLLGSGRPLPLEFMLDGRIEGDRRGIDGWARIGWLPTQPVEVRVEDDAAAAQSAVTRNVPLPGYRWPFRLDARGKNLRGSRVSVHARLPNGAWQPLPDSPLLLPAAIRRPVRAARLPPWRKAGSPSGGADSRPLPDPAPIDIIIPVYGDRPGTLACIQSVLATAGEQARVRVVDDATPEPTLAAALHKLATAGSIELLRNSSNIGFVRSVNRALSVNSGSDVVLLNSDTLVFGDWLARLRAAAYREPRIGTVTPFSNDGSIASYPRRYGGRLGVDEAAEFSKLTASAHAGVSAEIPVGVGFCLYIRHECLKDTGELDAEAFGVGYGEESDFCLRARERGWSHRLAADVFVYHAGGGSFGPRRAALLERSQRLLNLRFPGYDRYIGEFLQQDPLLPLRREMDEQRLAAHEGRFVLLVTLALEGGVERFVTERKQQIRAQGLIPLVLKPQSPGSNRQCELVTEALEVPNLRYSIPAELSELSAVLTRLPLERIEIQHFLGLDAAVIESLRALGVPYDVMIHDYAWICPRITLIDGRGRYCGEPAISVCESCVLRNGSRLPKSLSVAALRERSAAWLGQARSVSAPSVDTAMRMQKYFPNLDIVVRPLTPSLSPAPTLALPNPTPKGAKSHLRVGLIGAIGGHKGYRVLLECARDAAARRLPLEFVVIGFTENDRPLLRTSRVEVTGRYVDAEVAHLLRREQPDLLFLPSVWPETWCYALDHALSAGLPTVAFDIGAMAARLRATPDHALLPLELSARQVNERLLEIGAQRGAYVQSSQSGHGDVNKMERNKELQTMKTSPNEQSQEERLSASLQVLPLLPGLYLFTVTSATPNTDGPAGALRVPAVHVGLGPGVRSEHVEFVAGPSTEGAWLFARGDVLVARVNRAGATLVLTSVRASTGDVLSIEVERLESRLHSAPAAAAVANGARARDPALANGGDDGTVPLQIRTHIRSRGDMSFTDAPWAGRVAPGLWIESFSIQPLRSLAAHDVEYKGLTGTGFETPWLSNDQNCGTKGMSVPLVGFAVRLKPGPETAAYVCEYCGYYQSGTVVGPLRNGAPCRSTVANDPLEGIQIRFVRRGQTPPASGDPLPGPALHAANGASAGRARKREPESGPASRTLENSKPVKRGKPEGHPAG
jgi:GT2 family glycosyltransferase/glycosyltransferase involved in cell wall biosynthesis